ncbi:uncharacterized protein LOC141847949 [Curcuma longa]|uniref:uncharacterized protein LOC141847949 n=1 Tax=Curcuma longa TaxID=136217 RepID=UPI003D9F08DF
MASKVAVSGELPVLPPIKTAAPIRDKLPVVGGQASPGDGGGDEEGCVTPKSEEHYLKPLAVCPPAPRKPKPARRTSPAAATDSKVFRAVPRDLTSIFLSLPPKKRIRIA